MHLIKNPKLLDYARISNQYRGSMILRDTLDGPLYIYTSIGLMLSGWRDDAADDLSLYLSRYL